MPPSLDQDVIEMLLSLLSQVNFNLSQVELMTRAYNQLTALKGGGNDSLSVRSAETVPMDGAS